MEGQGFSEQEEEEEESDTLQEVSFVVFDEAPFIYVSFSGCGLYLAVLISLDLF